MRIKDIKETEYKMPINIKQSTSKYKYIISSDYGKYIEVLVACGGACMQNQFVEIVKIFNSIDRLSHPGYIKRANKILSTLEDYGFIEIGSFNKYNYIMAKQPSIILIEGDGKTNKRVKCNSLFDSNRFIYCVSRIQYFIERGIIYEYNEIFNQLMLITKMTYDAITSTRNIYGYSINSIERIMNLKSLKDIVAMLEEKPENEFRLGVIRTIWDELAKCFISFNRKGILPSDTPLHLAVHIQDDGFISLHYVPELIIFDAFKSIDYYNNINSFISSSFSSISTNNTLGIKNEFMESGKLGTTHFNRIGYSIKVILPNNDNIKNKEEVLNIPYYSKGMYAPLVKQCDVIIVEIGKYFNNATISSSNIELYKDSVSQLKRNLKEMVGEIYE